MGGQLLGEIGEAEDERAGGGRVDAAAGDALGFVTDGRGGGTQRPLVKGLEKLRCGWVGRRSS